MECRTAQRILWPLEGASTETEREEKARRHLADCRRCQAFFRRDRAVGELVREYGLAATAPEHLEARVRAALRSDRGRSPPPRRSPRRDPAHRRTRAGARTPAPEPPERKADEAGPAAAPPSTPPLAGRRAGLLAAASVAAAVFLGVLSPWGDAGLPSQVLATDYARHAFDEEMLLNQDPTAVRRFFQSQLGIAVRPGRLTGADLKGGMICWLRKQPVAMVMYELGGHPVAHYISRKEREPGASAVPEASPRSTRQGRVRLVRWEDSAHAHALVSDLPRRTVERLARQSFSLDDGD